MKEKRTKIEEKSENGCHFGTLSGQFEVAGVAGRGGGGPAPAKSMKNGLQVGGQNSLKIDKKVIQNLSIFSCFFKDRFERIFNGKSLENRLKNDAKIGPNLIINAESQNVENLLPVEAGSSKTRFRRVLNPSKFDEKSMLKVGSVPDRSPSWEAKSSKNRYKMVLKK